MIEQGDKNEEEQQFETLSMTEDPRLKSPSSPKNHRCPQSAPQYQHSG